MRFSKTSRRRFAALLTTASLSMITSAQAAAVEPYESNGLGVVVSGATATASVTLTASVQTVAKYAGICARTTTGTSADFPMRKRVALGPTPVTLTSSRTFEVGTYTYWACVNVNGRWYDVGDQKSFVVPTAGSSDADGPAPSPTPTSSPMPVGVPGSWSLAFADEFDGTTVDIARWNVTDGHNMNNVLTASGNVSVSNGELQLQLSSADGVVRGAMVTSSVVDGSGRRGFEAGIGTYTESRVFFPGSDAQPIYNWPAAWTSGQQWPSNGEHDYAEGLSGRLTANYHYLSSTGTHVANNSGPVSGTWHNGFHTYGVHRKAASADVYWDGRLIRSYPTYDAGGGHSLIFNVGRSNTRTPVLGAAGAVRVDYVRVWKQG